MAHGRETPLTAPPDLWDPVVRISHWGLAAAVFLNALLTREGSVAHIWIGWAGLSLLALRLVWGFVGPAEARFSAFPPNPRAALRHLRDLVARRPRAYRSHNPAGALMIYLLWALLAVVIGTGIAMTGTTPLGAAERQMAIETADWSTLDLGEGDHEGREALEEVHEVAANLILVLAFLHVAGVLVEGRLMRRNLVRPMLAGERRNASLRRGRPV